MDRVITVKGQLLQGRVAQLVAEDEIELENLGPGCVFTTPDAPEGKPVFGPGGAIPPESVCRMKDQTIWLASESSSELAVSAVPVAGSLPWRFGPQEGSSDA